MKATLDHIEDIAANIKTFWFKPEHTVHYTAGQFTELYLPHDNPDERGEKHWFTISSSPTDPLLSITTKFPAEGQRTSTFKQTLLALPIGSEVRLAEPMGDFVLPKIPTIPLLFFAGGIGVTPMHSMIKYLKDRGEQRDITLMYAVNHAEDMVFRELFESYSMKFIPIVTSVAGALTSQQILDVMNRTPDSLVYLSGPEPMIEALADGLTASGLDKRNVITDFFPGYRQF